VSVCQCTLPLMGRIRHQTDSVHDFSFILTLQSLATSSGLSGHSSRLIFQHSW
jgi:hypothetical protein